MDDLFSICSTAWNIDCLKEFQRNCLEALLKDNDVFVCCKTGSGKTLCFEMYPTLWRMFPRHGDVLVLIVEQLISIIDESSRRLRHLGKTATYIGFDSSEDDDILNGHFDYIFTTAESILGVEKWRNMLQCTSYQQNSLLIVVEVHTVVDW
jgi:superfamily II DNA helicase RecQ